MIWERLDIPSDTYSGREELNKILNNLYTKDHVFHGRYDELGLIEDHNINKVLELIRERCELLTEDMDVRSNCYLHYGPIKLIGCGENINKLEFKLDENYIGIDKEYYKEIFLNYSNILEEVKTKFNYRKIWNTTAYLW